MEGFNRFAEVLMVMLFTVSIPVFVLAGLYCQDAVLGSMLFGVAGLCAMIAAMHGMLMSWERR